MTEERDVVTVKDDKEAFLSRWSRLKRDAKDSQPPEKTADAAADPKAPPPELPALDKLTFESDYKTFFHPKVDEDVRRTALKKLFSDQHFNVMDGLDVYIDDYSKSEPIPPAMLAGLKQAQNILQWAKEDTEERARKERALKEASEAALPPPAAQPSNAAGVPPRGADPEAAPRLDGVNDTSKS